MAGYDRQEVFVDGDTILAEHGNNEFNQVEAAMAASGGHTHNGSATEGAPVPLISDVAGTDKVEIVAGGAKTTGTHQVTGVLTLDAGAAVTGSITVTGNVDGRDVSVDGAKLDTLTPATSSGITTAALLPSSAFGTIAATNTQAALEEIQAEIPITASQITFAPAGAIIATDTQAAIEEVATDADAKFVIAATPVLAGQLDGAENTFKDLPAAVTNLGSVSTTQNFDLSVANVFSLEPTTDITLTFSNIPSTGKAVVWFVEMLGAGDHTFTWPAAVVFDGGTEPTWAAGTETSVAQLYTRDGGTKVFVKLLFGSIV
jgi:hypothetical protein